VFAGNPAACFLYLPWEGDMQVNGESQITGSNVSYITMTGRQFALEIDAQRREAVNRVWLKAVAFGLVFGALYGAVTILLLQRTAA